MQFSAIIRFLLDCQQAKTAKASHFIQFPDNIVHEIVSVAIRSGRRLSKTRVGNSGSSRVYRDVSLHEPGLASLVRQAFPCELLDSFFSSFTQQVYVSFLSKLGRA